VDEGPGHHGQRPRAYLRERGRAVRRRHPGSLTRTDTQRPGRPHPLVTGAVLAAATGAYMALRSSTSAAFSASRTSSSADWSRAIVRCVLPREHWRGLADHHTVAPSSCLRHAVRTGYLHHLRGRSPRPGPVAAILPRLNGCSVRPGSAILRVNVMAIAAAITALRCALPNPPI
jgi:hypothetical protein